MRYILILLFLAFTTALSFAQESHWEKQILEKTKAAKVIRWEKTQNESSPWTVLLKVKKKVGIYTVSINDDQDEDGNLITYVDDVYTSIQPGYEEIQAFKKINKEDSNLVDYLQGQVVEIAEAILKNKSGIVVRYGDDYDIMYLDAQHFFHTIDWENNKGTCVPVMIDRKWGIYDWFKQVFIIDCKYASLNDLPKTASSFVFDKYTAKIFEAFNKKKNNEKIDLIDMDNNNGDGVFKVRNKGSKKWGLYQYLGDEIVEAIPMKFDSLYHFPWNGKFTAVFNDAKVGFYLSYWAYGAYTKQSVLCIYEDYKRYSTEDQIPKLAVKKDSKWGWIDWLTGEEKSEFKYDTPEDLPYPYYKQEMWLKE